MYAEELKSLLSAPVSHYNERELEDFMKDLSTKLVSNLMYRTASQQDKVLPTKVVDFMQPEDIRRTIDMKIDQPTDLKTLRENIDKVMSLSVRTDHPHFFNQLFAQADPVATIGDWVSATMNASMYTYEVAPVLTVMEKDVLALMEKYLGFSDETSKVRGNGIFCPGGSISNLLALNVARYWKFPQVKEEGMHSIPKVAYFVSELAHYSIKKGCQILGVGTKGMFEIKADNRGCMMIDELEKNIKLAISQGYVPTCITATAGTTVFGAYDDIIACHELAKKYEMWLHIDGAWGGSIVLTSEFKKHMTGIELADSITWNPHKLMGIPQQCSAMILHSRHETLLKDAHSTAATYLFQKDKANADLDTGDTTIQCGRRNDILKLWMMWKTIGTQGMTDRCDHVWNISRYLVEAIKQRPDRFYLINDPMCTNVCFYYVPPCLKDQFDFSVSYSEWTEEMKLRISKVCPSIKKMMQERGTMMCTYQAQKEHVNFWRMVLISSCLTYKDMDFVLDEIEECGKKLSI